MYEVTRPALVFEINEFIQVPTCDSSINYTIEVSDDDGLTYLPKPDWIG